MSLCSVEGDKKPSQQQFLFDPAVEILTPDTFEESTKNAKSALVMFYAPWCGHCKKSKPEFSAAAAQMKDEEGYLFAAVDCTVHRDLCKEHDVKGFPTFLFFENGKFLRKHGAGRTKDGFINGIKGKVVETPPAPPKMEFEFSPAVKVLDPETFEPTLKGASRALVMFFAPWCGHCRKAKPEFSAAATEMEGDRAKLYGAVDCTQHRDLCKAHDVRGYPTILIFEEGTMSRKFAASRTKQGFIDALSDAQKEETQTEKPAPKPEEGWGPGVKLLSSDNFESTLKDVRRALVMFYAPWCGHCKRAKPEFSAAATALAEDKENILAAVDCTQNKDICTERGVRGYPTFQLFEDGKFAEAYNGGRSKDSFVNFLSVKEGERKEEKKVEL